ncbi:hypothetical protein ACIQZG_00795 [Lysinibacillus sp. NPDC096418]|uniref:hypothetical protein n=1 Tax=Lysinibacillus sp. NPDC096418 TaxID=3364138 RepID=UPI0037F9B750
MFVNRININLKQLEEPLLIINDQDVLLFQQLIQPVVEFKLVECRLALSSRKSISLVRDIWLSLYKDSDKLIINSEHAMLYPIRLILFELVLKGDHFKRLADKSRGDECLSLLYAIIYMQFVIKWLKEKFQDNEQICDSMKILFPAEENYRGEDNHLTISREKTIAQALIVKSIRLEVQNNPQEFSSLLFQTYNLIEYLHEEASIKSGVKTTALPSMRNVAEVLNTFYEKRYVTNKIE